jgi:hypothetical protein
MKHLMILTFLAGCSLNQPNAAGRSCREPGRDAHCGCASMEGCSSCCSKESCACKQVTQRIDRCPSCGGPIVLAGHVYRCENASCSEFYGR